MKIYISLDMEGVAGTFNWKQEDSCDRTEVRRRMGEQIGWVIEGIHKSSINKHITEIAVADSHSFGDNLSYEISRVDNRLYLISGIPRLNYMMPGLDETFDAAFLLGYHAGTGTIHSNMDHTYSNSCIHNIWLNQRMMNEAFLNAAYAACYSVPVVLITGDKALENQILHEDGMPWVSFVTTKEALGKFSAMQRPYDVVKEDTISKTVESLEKDMKNLPLFNPPVSPDGVLDLKIEFQTTSQADFVEFMPFSKRVDGRTVLFSCKDYKVIFNAVMAMSLLARQG